jgi:hypothetical protein
LPHHNPDFQPPTGAAWRLMRGKMSISTMDGIAAIGWLQIRSTAGQILGKNNWIGVLRYLTASEYANFYLFDE